VSDGQQTDDEEGEIHVRQEVLPPLRECTREERPPCGQERQVIVSCACGLDGREEQPIPGRRSHGARLPRDDPAQLGNHGPHGCGKDGCREERSRRPPPDRQQQDAPGRVGEQDMEAEADVRDDAERGQRRETAEVDPVHRRVARVRLM